MFKKRNCKWTKGIARFVFGFPAIPAVFEK